MQEQGGSEQETSRAGRQQVQWLRAGSELGVPGWWSCAPGCRCGNLVCWAGLVVPGVVILGGVLVLSVVRLALSCFQVLALVLGGFVLGEPLLGVLVCFWLAKLASGVFGFVLPSLCLFGLLWVLLQVADLLA